MISDAIVLKKSPKIEFQFHENGFQVVDEQTERNSGFYSYNDVQSIKLNRAWFPRLSRWMRILTTITNGVPFFPDPDTYKFSSVTIHTKSSNLGMWLSDIEMADKAKMLKQLLDKKTSIKEN